MRQSSALCLCRWGHLRGHRAIHRALSERGRRTGTPNYRGHRRTARQGSGRSDARDDGV